MRESGSYFGLTGGIACGKSTVAAAFAELGARIVDADQIGHEVLLPSSPAFAQLVAAFGTDILSPSGEIDRRRLGALVFSDPAQLQELNAIVHPRIIERVEERVRELRAADPAAVVIVDAALIYESGIGGNFRKMIAAWCRPEQQLERLMAKSGLSREEAQCRICSQIPAAEKRRRADFVIDCSGTLEATRRQAQALYPQLRELARDA